MSMYTKTPFVLSLVFLLVASAANSLVPVGPITKQAVSSCTGTGDPVLDYSHVITFNAGERWGDYCPINEGSNVVRKSWCTTETVWDFWPILSHQQAYANAQDFACDGDDSNSPYCIQGACSSCIDNSQCTNGYVCQNLGNAPIGNSCCNPAKQTIPGLGTCDVGKIGNESCLTYPDNKKYQCEIDSEDSNINLCMQWIPIPSCPAGTLCAKGTCKDPTTACTEKCQDEGALCNTADWSCIATNSFSIGRLPVEISELPADMCASDKKRIDTLPFQFMSTSGLRDYLVLQPSTSVLYRAGGSC